ncbi:MAG: TlpA disulfide reductase family protein [Candidatus Zixiibacteriota bacterium]
MNRIIVILCAALVLLNLPACADNYGIKAFNKAYNKAASVAEAIDLCREYMDKTEKLADARDVQQEWMLISPETARQYALEKYKAEPDSKVAKYLYARTLENPYENLRLGHELTNDYPDWPYGYVMVTTTYLNAFDTLNRNDSLWTDIEEDSLCFLNLIDLWTDIRALYRYYKYQVFTGDYNGALKTADEFIRDGGTWIYPDDYAEILARAGRYKEASEKLRDYMKSQEIDGDKFVRYFHDRFVFLLYKAGAYDEILRHVQENAVVDSLAGYACRDMAFAFASQNRKDSALYYLNLAADRGYFSSRPDPDDTIFAAYQSDAQWKSYTTKCGENKKAADDKLIQSILPASDETLAPEIKLTDSEGHQVSLSDYRGKIVVIEFWVTWCGFSNKALPYLSKFAAQQDADNIQVLAIESPNAARNKIRYTGIFQANNYAMQLLFAEEDAEKEFGFEGFPTFFILDKNGHIRYRAFGFGENVTFDKINMVVKELAKE